MRETRYSSGPVCSQDELSGLLETAREILAVSEKQEWQELGVLVANWRGELDRYFDNDLDTRDAVTNLDRVRQLNEINMRVIALVEQYRESLSLQLRALRDGRKAISAYSLSSTK